MNMYIIKTLQRCFYDILLNKYQFIALSLLIIFILMCFSHIGEFIFRMGNDKYDKSYREPIDVVYTWVNGSDGYFRQALKSYLSNEKYDADDFSDERFDDKYELKFSLRSLEMYAPWIRHVYIVTNGQIPYWLNLDYDKVTVVSHDDIFCDKDDLPTFSSPAIESNIHRIKGLSERFIYFNDDIFLGTPTFLEDFVSPNRGYLIYLAWPLPSCVPDCPWAYVGDGQCDTSCYHVDCQFDGGDCNQKQSPFKSYLNDDEYLNIEDEDADKKDDEYDGYFQKPVQIKTEPKILKSDHNLSKVSTQNVTDKNNTNPKHPGRSNMILKNVVLDNKKNISDIVNEHNFKTLMSDKLRRRKRIHKSVKRKFVYQNVTNTNKTLKTYNGYDVVVGGEEKGLDTYALSLQHTNRIYNDVYGFKARKVPAHSPIFIDRHIMEQMQTKFKKEFEKTSKNRLRSANDMQYSFSYYYHLIDEKLNRTIDEIFDMFDTDESGTWSDREIRTLLTRINSLPLSFGMVELIDNAIINCSKNMIIPNITTPLYERYIDSKLPTVTKELIRKCPFITNILQEHFGKISKYKYEIIKNSQSQHVMFKMLTSNISTVVAHLDEIRKQPRKFVCINDNMDPKKMEDNELVKAILMDFYLSLFPKPSKYELPPEYRNRFAYLQELNDWKMYHVRVKLILFLCIILISVFCFYNTCKRKLLRQINGIIYFYM